MPRKKSITKSANKFKDEVNEIIELTESIGNLSAKHKTWCYEFAVIRLYRSFEYLVLESLVGALNNDTSTLSSRTGFAFPKHLTDEVCQFLVTGQGYFDFKGREGIIKQFKKFLPEDHYLISIFNSETYKKHIDQLSASRNYASHSSKQARKSFLRATGQKKASSPGSWLKSQNRFEEMAKKLISIADDLIEKSPY